MTDESLRVVVVDDTVTYRHIVRQALEEIPGVDVVGTAIHGRAALDRIEQLKPDLLTLDLEMPELDGLGVLRELKRTGSRVGAIMLSAFTKEGAQSTLAALELGAFDFVLKPQGTSPHASMEALRCDLSGKIEAFRRTRLLRSAAGSSGTMVGAGQRGPARTAAASSAPPAQRAAGGDDCAQRLRNIANSWKAKIELVVLGVSTGGPRALTEMLPQLPGDLAVPVLIVQHMPPVFTRSLAEDLNRKCALTIEEASQGQRVVAGQVLIAPGGKQMRIERAMAGLVVRITDDPPENSCRPSVDYLFRSAAEVQGGGTLGVIMTGMGNDGSAGCRLLKERGATILAQDEASCVVFGMPREPIETGVADIVAPLNRIAAEIVQCVGKGGLRARNT